MEVHDLGEFAAKNWPAPEKGFAKMIQNIDRDTGRIIDLVRELKIADNTLVIFTSDNGPHQEGGHLADYFNSNGKLRGMKRDLTEGGIRVPTIAWWPGTIKAGGADDAHWYFGDFMATLADLSGAKPPADIDSDSFAGPLKGTPRTNQWKREHEMYWEFYERGSAQAVRFSKWKAIRKPMFTGPIELYDMSNDASEKGLRQAPPDLARHAANLMEKMHTPDPNWKVRGGGDLFRSASRTLRPLHHGELQHLRFHLGEAIGFLFRKVDLLGGVGAKVMQTAVFKTGFLMSPRTVQKHVLAW